MISTASSEDSVTSTLPMYPPISFIPMFCILLAYTDDRCMCWNSKRSDSIFSAIMLSCVLCVMSC